MSADIELEVSFGATKGLPNYSSERADQRLRITIHSEGDALPEWLNDSVAVEDQLRNHLVYGVAEALSLEAAMSEGGKASLVWPESSPPPQQPAPGPASQPPAGAAPAPQGGGGGQRAPAKATREQVAALPRFAMDFGQGMKMYVDQRPLKADGTYSPKAPDFKEDIANGEGKWIKDANGNLNPDTQRAMTASNVQ